MSQPAKVATPATAATGPLLVQPNRERVGEGKRGDLGGGRIVTKIPPASSTVTTGCCAKFVPPVAVVLGWVVNARWVAAPTDTVMQLLVAAVRIPSAACSV